ncbi:U2-type spliceosomal complex subunit CWC23 Ecym_1097 [Eremothecium cymbalariae DBVPG|uniref:J domain-containing protein n=1 Tax=Eremothecium cymbalariae (strain CBS 270.75 / DBVPG 7215 / KCTC 17166 / NRRL Y-17582) TaxID=931890 RepID=G8JME4_ERECY|nr:hypothetical protein Ecym_1097 [Eremothecium cymbalariae DBVPG\
MATVERSIDSDINLYDELQIAILSKEDLNNVSISQLRKQYRQMALKYHPDKSTAPNAQEKFLKIKLAFDVLSDSDSRKRYNQWFQKRHFGDEHRRLQIKRLKQREAQQKSLDIVDPSELQRIQEYGQHLRKLLHFKQPYGDWKNVHFESRDTRHTLRESCTLRIALKQNATTRNKQTMKQLFKDANFPVVDMFFSSRNVETDDEHVLYTVMHDLAATTDLLNNWTEKDTLKSYISGIRPYVNVEYFHFEGTVKLDSSIMDKVGIDPQVIV